MTKNRAPLRWFQFSLRGMMVAVTLLAIFCGWVGVRIAKARRQKAAVDAIVSGGGWFFYDYQLTPGDPDAAPPGPAWLRNFVGDDFFASVVEVGSFSGSGIDTLEACPELKTCNLSGSYVTDAGLEHLQNLRTLEELNLQGSFRVSDDGLRNLKALTGLRKLNLGNIAITSAGLKHLQGLTQLRSLILEGCPRSSDGLKYLTGMSQLEELKLDENPITDAGLQHLTGLSQLQSLSLIDSRVTDAGLPYLSNLRLLRSLDLRGTRVTEVGVAKLHGLLPECEIQH